MIVEVFIQIRQSRVDFLCSKMSLDMRTVCVFLTGKEVEQVLRGKQNTSICGGILLVLMMFVIFRRYRLQTLHRLDHRRQVI